MSSDSERARAEWTMRQSALEEDAISQGGQRDGGVWRTCRHQVSAVGGCQRTATSTCVECGEGYSEDHMQPRTTVCLECCPYHPDDWHGSRVRQEGDRDDPFVARAYRYKRFFCGRRRTYHQCVECLGHYCWDCMVPGSIKRAECNLRIPVEHAEFVDPNGEPLCYNGCE